MEKLKQIETMTLRDFIHQEMTKLHTEVLEFFQDDLEEILSNMIEIMHKNSQLIILQEIAYRLEFGFITEIGTKSLKEHLAEPI